MAIKPGSNHEELAKFYNFSMNINYIEENILNMIAMCVDCEQYLLSQLALMRKAFGYGGMSYEMHDDLITNSTLKNFCISTKY